MSYTTAGAFNQGLLNPIIVPIPTEMNPTILMRGPPPHKFSQPEKPKPKSKCNGDSGYKTLGELPSDSIQTNC